MQYKYKVCKGQKVLALSTTLREAEDEARRVGGQVLPVGEKNPAGILNILEELDQRDRAKAKAAKPKTAKPKTAKPKAKPKAAKPSKKAASEPVLLDVGADFYLSTIENMLNGPLADLYNKYKKMSADKIASKYAIAQEATSTLMTKGYAGGTSYYPKVLKPIKFSTIKAAVQQALEKNLADIGPKRIKKERVRITATKAAVEKMNADKQAHEAADKFPLRPSGVRGPFESPQDSEVSPPNRNYFATLLAPKCLAPVAYFLHNRDVYGYSPDLTRYYTRGYFDGSEESEAGYPRVHMSGLEDTYADTGKGVGPLAYMAMPLAAMSKFRSEGTVYSPEEDGGPRGYCYRTKEADRAWANLIKHGIAYQETESGSEYTSETFDVEDYFQAGEGVLDEWTDVEDVEPSYVTVTGTKGGGEMVIDVMTVRAVLMDQIALHIDDDLVRRLDRDGSIDLQRDAISPPAASWAEIDMLHCTPDEVVQMVEFCSTHAGVSADDYLREVAGVIGTNPTYRKGTLDEMFSQKGIEIKTQNPRRKNPAAESWLARHQQADWDTPDANKQDTGKPEPKHPPKGEGKAKNPRKAKGKKRNPTKAARHPDDVVVLDKGDYGWNSRLLNGLDGANLLATWPDESYPNSDDMEAVRVRLIQQNLLDRNIEAARDLYLSDLIKAAQEANIPLQNLPAWYTSAPAAPAAKPTTASITTMLPERLLGTRWSTTDLESVLGIFYKPVVAQAKAAGATLTDLAISVIHKLQMMGLVLSTQGAGGYWRTTLPEFHGRDLTQAVELVVADMSPRKPAAPKAEIPMEHEVWRPPFIKILRQHFPQQFTYHEVDSDKIQIRKSLGNQIVIRVRFDTPSRTFVVTVSGQPQRGGTFPNAATALRHVNTELQRIVDADAPAAMARPKAAPAARPVPERIFPQSVRDRYYEINGQRLQEDSLAYALKGSTTSGNSIVRRVRSLVEAPTIAEIVADSIRAGLERLGSVSYDTEETLRPITYAELYLLCRLLGCIDANGRWVGADVPTMQYGINRLVGTSQPVAFLQGFLEGEPVTAAAPAARAARIDKLPDRVLQNLHRYFGTAIRGSDEAFDPDDYLDYYLSGIIERMFGATLSTEVKTFVTYALERLGSASHGSATRKISYLEIYLILRLIGALTNDGEDLRPYGMCNFAEMREKVNSLPASTDPVEYLKGAVEGRAKGGSVAKPTRQQRTAADSAALFPKRCKGESYSNKVTRTQQPVVTIIAPLCKQPMVVTSYKDGYDSRVRHWLSAPDKSVVYAGGYEGQSYEDKYIDGADYARQHMLPGVLTRVDYGKGCGPASYMAGPFVARQRDSKFAGVYSYFGGRSDEAEAAWLNLIAHKTAEVRNEVGRKESTLKLMPLVDYAKYKGGSNLLPSNAAKWPLSVQPAQATLVTLAEGDTIITLKHMLEIGFVLHMDPSVENTLTQVTRPFTPPPEIWKELDLSATDKDSLEKMLKFCASRYAKHGGNIAEGDYLYAAALNVAENPSLLMHPEEAAEWAATFTVKPKASKAKPKASRAKKQNPDSGLSAFLSDESWAEYGGVKNPRKR